MEKKTWEIILIVFVLVVFSLVPVLLNISIIHYVTSVVCVIAILLAFAYFVMNTSTPISGEAIQEESEEEKTKWQQCVKSLKRSWKKVYDACNNVGFILFLCILLIIGIGVFDALMSKNNEVKADQECKVTIENVVKSPEQAAMEPSAQNDTIK